MTPIRVVIVDDHPIVREGLAAVLRETLGIEPAGEAGSGEEAVDVVARTRPDLVLLDLMMPGMDGVSTIAALKRIAPRVAVVVLTAFAGAGEVVAAIRAGADGFLLKDTAVQELAHALRTVHGGRPYLHPEAARHLLAGATRPEPPAIDLTPREQEVLGFVARGLTNREIALRLGISAKTVSVHVSGLLAKMGLSSRTQAALHATRVGLVRADELACA